MSGPKVSRWEVDDETQYAPRLHKCPECFVAVFPPDPDETLGLPALVAYANVVLRHATPEELRAWARTLELAAQHIETGVQPELEPAGES